MADVASSSKEVPAQVFNKLGKRKHKHLFRNLTVLKHISSLYSTGERKSSCSELRIKEALRLRV